MAVAEGRFLKAFAWSVHLGYRKVCARLIPPILTLKITGCGWLIQSSAPDLWHLWSNASGWECYCMATSPGNTWVREKSRKQCMVPKGGNPLQTARKKPAREEDILDFFFQDKGCCPATSPPQKKKKTQKNQQQKNTCTWEHYRHLLHRLGAVTEWWFSTPKGPTKHRNERNETTAQKHTCANFKACTGLSLGERNIETLPQPSYSPALASRNLFFITLQKKYLACRLLHQGRPQSSAFLVSGPCTAEMTWKAQFWPGWSSCKSM